MILRIIRKLLLFIAISILIILVFLLAPPLYRHFITYPKLDREVSEMQKLRKSTVKLTGLDLYRGVMHVHSFWSHDSEGTLADIIPAAKDNNIDFIFLTDHPHGNIDTLPRGFNGIYEGVLIKPGSEKQGFDTWPPDSVIIDWNIPRDTIVKNIVGMGGIVFYAHTEEPHNWSNPWFQGMEIYNFHADTKDEKILPQVFNFIVNGKRYRQWALREMFDEQTRILALWDSLNTKRKIVGFSAVDTHENQNIRARYLNDGRIEWVGPDANVIDTTAVSFWNTWLISPPDSSGWIFKFMIDTYKDGFNYITNYIFADTLTVLSLSDNIKKGHIYTAFRSIADAEGFNYFATDQDDEVCAILGDSVSLGKVKALKAVSPMPGQFRLIRNGKQVASSSYNNYEYAWEEMIEKGAYRIEIHFMLEGKDIPWLYSNPIYIY